MLTSSLVPLPPARWVLVMALAGWSCGGVSDEARIQSADDVAHGLGYLRECDERTGRCNIPAAITAWERAIRLDPENADAHFYLGTQLMVSDLTRAETLLRRAVTLYEAKAATDERQRAPLADARNSLGVVLMNRDRAAEALPLFRAASEEITYTRLDLAYGNVGWALLVLGRHADAVAPLTRAVSIQPAFCVGWARLGSAHLHANDYGHALEALDRALGTTQQGCDRLQGALLDRAKVRIQLRQPERAREDLTRCVELEGSTTEGRECAELARTVAP